MSEIERERREFERITAGHVWPEWDNRHRAGLGVALVELGAALLDLAAATLTGWARRLR